MEAIIRNHHDAFNPEDEYRMAYANMLRGMLEEEQDEWDVIDLRKMIKENSPRPLKTLHILQVNDRVGIWGYILGHMMIRNFGEQIAI